jgi:hypothetical protein
MAWGCKTDPFPTSQYWKKFEKCTIGLMAAADQQRVRQALERFTRLSSVRELTQSLGVDLNPVGSSGPV